MWKKLDQEGKKKYLKQWIREITKDETSLSIRRHIIKHAKEIFEKNPKEWSASMRNLIEVYEVMNKIRPSEKLRLVKLHKKYLRNPKRYTSPPNKMRK
jgi:hypothetical protein